jgi:hypothetical protein
MTRMMEMEWESGMFENSRSALRFDVLGASTRCAMRRTPHGVESEIWKYSRNELKHGHGHLALADIQCCN